MSRRKPKLDRETRRAVNEIRRLSAALHGARVYRPSLNMDEIVTLIVALAGAVLWQGLPSDEAFTLAKRLYPLGESVWLKNLFSIMNGTGEPASASAKDNAAASCPGCGIPFSEEKKFGEHR